jgi:hypothetical protein
VEGSKARQRTLSGMQAHRRSHPDPWFTTPGVGLIMFWLKLCPKCRGDLYGEQDCFGPYVGCLQCGRYLTRAEEKALGVRNPGRSPFQKKATRRRPRGRRAALARRLTGPRHVRMKKS